MDAVNDIFQFLDRHTGFAQDLDDLVQAPQWSAGWLTSHQIAQEVERFQFWAGLRSRVPQQTRPLLLDFYLRRSADSDDSGWACLDDQFKFNPDEAGINNTEEDDSQEIQNRRHGRVNCEMLFCQIGEVVNLSASGIMIKGKGTCEHNQDDSIQLDLTCLDHKLQATARMAWIKQDNSTFQAGMEFVDLTADQAQLIRELLPIASAVQAVSEAPQSGQVINWGK
jgi:hypothetical protein